MNNTGQFASNTIPIQYWALSIAIQYHTNTKAILNWKTCLLLKKYVSVEKDLKVEIIVWNVYSLVIENWSYSVLWSFCPISLHIIISSTFCFWILILQNDSLMFGIAHFVLVLLSIGYCSFSKKEQYQYRTGPSVLYWNTILQDFIIHLSLFINNNIYIFMILACK